ncbi:Putative hemolysin [Modicisalibacter muralis]|uniref:L-ornithine N(alpha)-acyltransferase n=1 Tax=Modicisalibacter muralis TaxID=119000 RepID=A0A1G9FRZ3_9GAMM|nr:lysophospholipid acyltransferase family protein [Halomonas muralis]SDK91169.1 Putative hemolysin [Halomonas muralis]
MLDIAHAVTQKYPALARQPALIRQPALGLLRRLTHEVEINRFLDRHQDVGPFEFIDHVLARFTFSYLVSPRERENIPSEGRVIIVANHPLGTLDGLALLRLVGEVRRDVKILANDLLWQFSALRALLLPVDNLTRSGYRQSMTRIVGSLMNEEVVIVFPAGEVSRAGPSGIKDGPWQSGFLHFARKTNAPILPVHLGGKNSALFYSLSLIYRPLGGLLLVDEMFKKHAVDLPVRVGEPIPLERFDLAELPTRTKVKLLRKHVYRLPKNKKSLFATVRPIAHPEDRAQLRRELRDAECLGQTHHGMRILLLDYRNDSAVMRELGRLRELTFRRIGEGTGRRLDLDDYDRHYRHLLVWDEEALEIAGAYRIGEVGTVLRDKGPDGLYSSSLFAYPDGWLERMSESIELGRSFVQPRYWGRRSLDLLWYGIGAYLKTRPEVRWMFGPVSISNAMPRAAQDLLVSYYRHYYGASVTGVKARAPFQPLGERLKEAGQLFIGNDARHDFKMLKEQLALHGVTVPALYKHYTELCEPGGVSFVDFGIDADFGYCVDGLVQVEVARITERKRLRYIG